MDAVNVGDTALQIGDFTTGLFANSTLLISNFIVLIVLTVLFVLISYRSRAGIISLAVSFYMGYALYIVFPYSSQIIDSGGSPVVKALISVAIYAACCAIPFLFIERLVTGGIGVVSVFPRFGLSFLCAAFLMALSYHTFQIHEIYTFPEPLNSLFAPDQFFFYWFVAPLIGLFILVH